MNQLMDDGTSQSNMSTDDESRSTPGTAAPSTTSSISIFGDNRGRSAKMPAEDANDPAPVTKAHSTTQIAIIDGTTSSPFGSGFGFPASRPPPTIFHPDNLVTLLIGQKEEKMVVCEAYLARDSGFFRAALKKQWSEGQSRVIKLPEETTVNMQHYIEYVFSGKPPTHSLSASMTTFGPEPWRRAQLLASLYVLGERMLNPRFQNDVIKELFRLNHFEAGTGNRMFTPFTSASPVNIIYQGTTESSPARRLMVDFATGYALQHWLLDDGLDPTFVLDFTWALLRKVHSQQSVRDFCWPPLKAGDYLVCEDV
jgi:hypothetical protein